MAWWDIRPSRAEGYSDFRPNGEGVGDLQDRLDAMIDKVLKRLVLKCGASNRLLRCNAHRPYRIPYHPLIYVAASKSRFFRIFRPQRPSLFLVVLIHPILTASLYNVSARRFQSRRRTLSPRREKGKVVNSPLQLDSVPESLVRVPCGAAILLTDCGVFSRGRSAPWLKIAGL